MLENVWTSILDWFSDRSKRTKLVRGFNNAAKEAYVQGIVPTLLKAEFSKGNSEYRHQFSDWLLHGFRVTAFVGKQLSKNELIEIGTTVLSDAVLVRQLVVLGFDTLEVQGDIGVFGCMWQLTDHIAIGN